MQIQIHGDWRNYTNVLPDGSQPVGVVTTDGGRTGALVRLVTGMYVQVNNGIVHNLPQRDVIKALLGPRFFQ
jgi:hypothetical protein